MKTLNRMIVCVALFACGCSGIRVSQDYEPSMVFSELKTYQLDAHAQENKGDIRTNNPLMDERITAAIHTSLGEKGMIESSSNPDVLVAYQYDIHTKLSSSSSGPSLGIGLGTSNRNSVFGFSTGTDIGQYDEGRLVIDMKRGTSGKLIWRGTSTFRVETHVKPEKMTEQINAAVKKTLAQFPPQRG